ISFSIRALRSRQPLHGEKAGTGLIPLSSVGADDLHLRVEERDLAECWPSVMPSQYQQIKGERYERELLDIARQKARDGRGFLRELGQDVAERLWEAAMDGRGVTATERKTLEFIMEGGDGQFTVSAAGKAYLRRKLDQEPPVGGGGRPAAAERQPAAEPPGGRGMGSGGYYRRVQGMNYDRALLEPRLIRHGGGEKKHNQTGNPNNRP
ncbi:unnamed protein product, partial [Prorocentrum cordatum]